MGKSAIFDDILNDIGYFEPKEFRRLTPNANIVENFDSMFQPNNETLIAYFPGCFSHFHAGHVKVVHEAYQRLHEESNGNFLLVIVPSHSDYAVEKYGAESHYATNKYRYDRIVEALNDDYFLMHEITGKRSRIWIDLNPMLNWTCDQNFTDLLDDFIRNNVRGLSGINGSHAVPYIICGKDRTNFSKIEQVTNKIRVMAFDGFNNGMSSRQYIEKNPLPIAKKNLILRCHNVKEYGTFLKYYGDQFDIIEPSYISDEIDEIKHGGWSGHSSNCVTICKDYAGILQYYPVHRRWANPFRQTGYNSQLREWFNSDAHITIIDSDIYSGGTKKFVSSLFDKCEFLAVHTVRETSNIEIIDIDDFIGGTWKYPYVDLQSRASLRPFTCNDFHMLEKFINELKVIQ